jgi:hypothetical protein
MPWFKVDDQLAFHPKVIAAGNLAMGLWARAGSWSAANLTDGRIPRRMITSMGARTRDAQRLVEAGLWVAVGCGSDHAQHVLAKFQPNSSQIPAKIEPETCVSECPLCAGVPGYQFVSWTEYQPTKAQVEREREATRVRVREHRNGRRNAVTPGVTNGAGTAAPSRPVPSVPKGTAGGSAARTAETEAEDPTTQAVIGVWIDRQNVRPAKRHIGHVAKVVKELLSEGFTPEHVHAGLTAMDTKGLSPSNLPTLVSSAANGNGVVRSLRPGQSTQQPSRLEPWNL